MRSEEDTSRWFPPTITVSSEPQSQRCQQVGGSEEDTEAMRRDSHFVLQSDLNCLAGRSSEST